MLGVEVFLLSRFVGFGCVAMGALMGKPGVAKPELEAAVIDRAATPGADINDLLREEGWTVLALPSNILAPGKLYRPGASSTEGKCVDVVPITGDLPSIEAQGSRGFFVDVGTNSGPVGGGVEVQATSFRLKSTTEVEQVVIEGMDMKLSQKCAQHLQDLRSDGASLTDLVVIQETVRARVKEIKCSSRAAAAKIRALWIARGELGESSDCVQSSEVTGVIAYKGVPVAQMRVGKSSVPAPDASHSHRVKTAKLALLTQANAAFQPLVPLLSKPISDDSRAALMEHYQRYRNAEVVVDGTVERVSVPSVEAIGNALGVKEAPAPQLAAEEARLGIDMVQIPAGEFVMGFSGLFEGEGPPHRVRITRSFHIMKAEMTQGTWIEVTSENPPVSAMGCERWDAWISQDDHPVYCVSWLDMVTMANALSQRTGLESCYQIDGAAVTWPKGLDCKGYRLPTEAEWEYAAQGGAGSPKGVLREFAGQEPYRVAVPADLDEVAWNFGNSDGKTHPVCGKRKNGYGLCDMIGNVYEWVWDRDSPYRDDPIVIDPLGSSDGDDFRILRGGGGNGDAGALSVTYRGDESPDFRNGFHGGRFCRTAE
jgi:formylglycine-generating enzyme required for sulfatase activity